MTTVSQAPPTGEGESIPLRTRSKYTIDDTIINHELRRKLWDGMLPLKLEMSIDDLFSSKMPSALYVRYANLICCSDYGTKRKLLLFHFGRNKVDVRLPCPARENWKLRRNVVRVQRLAPKMEPSNWSSIRHLVWNQPEARTYTMDANFPLQRQPNSTKLLVQINIESLPVHIHKFA